MESKNSISIKRSIAIKAIVTPTWKEDAEKELSKTISNIDQQLSQLEQEGQQIVNNIRSQSVNPLETEILSSEFINQVQLVGQDKKCLTALVVPNIEMVKNKFLEEDLSILNLDKNIGTFFKSQINNLLKGRLGSRSEEQILDCYFVDAFTLENGLLTQTLKQKRKEIEKQYASQIENMYENKFSKKI